MDFIFGILGNFVHLMMTPFGPFPEASGKYGGPLSGALFDGRPAQVLRAKKVFMMKLKSRSNQELPSVPVHAEAGCAPTTCGQKQHEERKRSLEVVGPVEEKDHF